MAGDDELKDEGGSFEAYSGEVYGGEPLGPPAEVARPIEEPGESDALLPPTADAGEPASPPTFEPQDEIESAGQPADNQAVSDQRAPEATFTINGGTGAPAPADAASSAEAVPFVHANTISPPPTAPIRSPSSTHDYPLPREPEPQPSGADELLQHLPAPAAPRIEPPRRPAQPGPNAAGESAARPLPRVVVMVTLAEAKADTNDLLEADAKRMTPQFQQVAKSEIAEAFSRQQSERRAADPYLRGRY